MSETDWELKDRRIAWMNINSACASVVAARINAGLFKPKSREDAIQDLLSSITIEFEAFLNIRTKDTSHKTDVGGPSTEEESPVTSSSPNKSEPFLKDVGSKPFVGASPPSPQKKGKGKVVEGEWFCSTGGCGQKVSTRVWEFSNDKYGRTLCFDCQDQEKARIENAQGPKDIGKY